MEEKYQYYQHGLLFIVYRTINTGMSEQAIEDSRWEDERKAKNHCDILNEKMTKEESEDMLNWNCLEKGCVGKIKYSMNHYHCEKCGSER